MRDLRLFFVFKLILVIILSFVTEFLDVFHSTKEAGETSPL